MGSTTTTAGLLTSPFSTCVWESCPDIYTVQSDGPASDESETGQHTTLPAQVIAQPTTSTRHFTDSNQQTPAAAASSVYDL